MKIRKMMKILKILIPILLVLIMTSCADTESDSDHRGAVITGSDMVGADSLNTYSAANSEIGPNITDWSWNIEGDASIEENNGETIKVRADDIAGTGSSTLRLQVCCDGSGQWSDATTKEVVINRYVFNVYFTNVDKNMGTFSGTMSATGETATWVMSAVDVYYKRYHIEFTGNTVDLPDNIDVSITWSQASCSYFYWGKEAVNSGTVTVSVPRTGGTIGWSGTVLNAGSAQSRPLVKGASSGDTAGTVTFKNKYFKTLVLTIVRP
jgi:hypothetical protein